MNSKFIRKLIFRIRQHYFALVYSKIRVTYWRMLGMKIGAGTKVCGMKVTWPHKIVLGKRCSLEQGVYLNVAGSYTEGVAIDIGDCTFIGNGCEFNIVSRITIGRDCLIGGGSRFIDHDHGISADRQMINQPEVLGDITIGVGAWIGAECVVLKGVTIGEGAVIAAGSVVTRSVQANAIYAGIPARFVRMRP